MSFLTLEGKNDFQSRGYIWTGRKYGWMSAPLYFPMGVTCPKHGKISEIISLFIFLSTNVPDVMTSMTGKTQHNV